MKKIITLTLSLLTLNLISQNRFIKHYSPSEGYEQRISPFVSPLQNTLFFEYQNNSNSGSTIQKNDIDGNIIWSKTIPFFISKNSVMHNGNLLICGTSFNFSSSTSLYFASIDTVNGNINFVNEYQLVGNTGSNITISEMKVLSNGDAIMVGSGTFSASTRGYLCRASSTTGNLVYQKVLQETNTKFYSVTEFSSYSLYLHGENNTQNFQTKITNSSNPTILQTIHSLSSPPFSAKISKLGNKLLIHSQRLFKLDTNLTTNSFVTASIISNYGVTNSYYFNKKNIYLLGQNSLILMDTIGALSTVNYANSYTGASNFINLTTDSLNIYMTGVGGITGAPFSLLKSAANGTMSCSSPITPSFTSTTIPYTIGISLNFTSVVSSSVVPSFSVIVNTMNVSTMCASSSTNVNDLISENTSISYSSNDYNYLINSLIPIVEVEVIDITGRIISKEKINNTNQYSFSLKNFASSVYLLNITYDNHLKSTHKIIN